MLPKVQKPVLLPDLNTCGINSYCNACQVHRKVHLSSASWLDTHKTLLGVKLPTLYGKISQTCVREGSQVHDTAQRILNALAAASPDAHKALLGVVVPTLEAVWQRIAGMAPAIAADVEGEWSEAFHCYVLVWQLIASMWRLP